MIQIIVSLFNIIGELISKNLETPIIVAISAMLAIVNARNALLAEKTRSILEKIESETDEKVFDLLESQKKQFFKRFESTSRNFNVLLSVLIMAIFLIVCNPNRPNSDNDFIEPNFYYKLLSLCCALTFCYSLLLLILEVINGKGTLKDQLKISEIRREKNLRDKLNKLV